MCYNVYGVMKLSKQKYYDNYFYGVPNVERYLFENKDYATRNYVGYMLARTQRMFRWSGLPDTIPVRSLELYLQVNGNVCFAEYNGDLYAFVGGLGGTPNPYYMPTVCIVSNPALKLSKTYTIDDDCVIVPNDSIYLGLMPLLRRYASMLIETDISMKRAIINSRIYNLISASDDATKASAEKFLSDMDDGKPGIIASNAFLEGVKSQPYGTTGTNVLTDLIEVMQYQKASMFNELGLNANYNMKRESLNSAESQLNDDALLPLVDDMLEQRRLGAEKINAMFGTSIMVDFASSWEDNAQELEAEQKAIQEEENPVSGQPETPDEVERGDDDEQNETK